MMLAHVPEHVEPGHCLHFDVRDDHLRPDGVELLDRFWRGVEGKHLMPFFPAERYNDLYHGGLIIDNYDFRHTACGGYCRIEKRKAKLRNSHRGRIPSENGVARGT